MSTGLGMKPGPLDAREVMSVFSQCLHGGVEVLRRTCIEAERMGTSDDQVAKRVTKERCKAEIDSRTRSPDDKVITE